jgi:hypothetical protein
VVKFLLVFWLAFGGLTLLAAVIWTALHSWLFTGCALLVLAVVAIVAVWGSQNERL